MASAFLFVLGVYFTLLLAYLVLTVFKWIGRLVELPFRALFWLIRLPFSKR